MRAITIQALIFLSLTAQAKPPTPTTLPLGLVGTIIREEPEKSLSTVLFTQSKQASTYKSGERLGTIAKIVKIERDKLTIQNSKTGETEFIKLGAYNPELAASKSSVESPVKQKELHVRRQLVNDTIKDLPSFLQMARAVPVTGPDGTVNGFQLEWIAPGSLYEKLGLQNGDTLLEVNGVKLTSIQSAVEIFTQFQNSSMIRLGAQRKGKPLELTYLIRE